MIRIMIVDDSPTVRALIRAILADDPDIRVVGEAVNGLDAVRLAAEVRPDVITMDVLMPAMDGLEATREIMIQAPTRIVIVSGHSSVHEVAGSMQALRMGALTVLPKPPSPGDPRFATGAAEFIKTLKSMAEVKVIRQWRERAGTGGLAPRQWERPAGVKQVDAVGVASSTGGPTALQQIFAALPGNFASPILVVQHMPTGFTQGLSDWLDASCPLTVKLAEPEEELKSGTVYLAPEGRHLGVAQGPARVLLSRSPPIGGFQPSATFLFESLARAFGVRAVGVILTGMGRDGVDGLRQLREAGGRVIAQNEATSIVYGMPFEVVKEGLANDVLPLDLIPRAMVEIGHYEHSHA